MAQLNTRIILRNDSTINWEASKDQILLKGEVGIEFLADGSTKLKIGDGVKSWAELDYFGGDFDTAAIDNLTTKLNALETALGQDGETPTGVFEDLAELRSRVEIHDTTLETLDTDLGELENLVGAPTEGEVPASGLFERLEDVEKDVANFNTALAGKANASEVYTIAEVDNAIDVAIANADHLKRVKVENLDAVDLIADDAEQYIYMVPATAEDDDLYDEYMVLDGKLEKVGSWGVDLTGYAKAEDLQNLQTKVNSMSDELVDVVKQDELTSALINKVEKTELNDYAKLIDIQNFITQEDVANLTTIINNKVEKVEGKDLVSNDEIAKLLTVEANAEENFIKAVQEGQFNVDETGKLTLIAVDQALIGGLINANNEADTLANILNEKANKQAIENINTALNNKVDKNGTDRLITEEEAKKLEKLVISDDGSVGISGTINAANVKELYDNVVRIVTGTGTYEFDGVAKELLGIEKGAQVNTIEKVTLAGGSPLIVTDKTVDIPLAIGTAGLVKSSAEENKVAVGADGTMEVNSLNVNKLVQTEGDVVILNGGNSTGEY